MLLASTSYAKPLQIESELASLCGALNAAGVKSYLEIGARYGGSFGTIMRALGHGCHGVAVDFPGHHFGDQGQDSAPILMGEVARLKDRGIHASVIWGPSQAKEVVERVVALGPFDAVMIDADHSYDAVSADYQVYAPLAKKCVVLHDIVGDQTSVSRTGRVVEVPKLWRELQERAVGDRRQEIVSPGSNMGIGIVWL